ncbi:MAG: T9SS type A sorting domain-containing protein, partial [Candidatus Paceibacterota bacterium]
AGTYWLVYQVHATNDGALFFPAVTLPGVRSLVVWNAKQRDTAGTWTSIVDAGNPATPPSVPLAMPFNINYTLNLSVGDASLNSIKVYPNPTSDNLYISGSNLAINNIEVLDVNGRILKSVDFANLTEVSIDLSGLTNGVYIVSIKSDEGTINRKIVKQK